MVDKMLAMKALAVARVQLDSALEHVDEVMKSLLTDWAVDNSPASEETPFFDHAANGSGPTVKDLVENRALLPAQATPRTSGQFASVVLEVMQKRGKEIHVSELREEVAPAAFDCEKVIVKRGKKTVPLFHQSIGNALIRLQQLGRLKPGHARGWYALTEKGVTS